MKFTFFVSHLNFIKYSRQLSYFVKHFEATLTYNCLKNRTTLGQLYFETIDKDYEHSVLKLIIEINVFSLFFGLLLAKNV